MTPRRVFAIALILSALGLLWLHTASAQTGGGLLFGRVHPARVTEAVIVRGMGEDERVWRGTEAASVAVQLKTLEATEYTATDHIRAWSWDWDRGQPRRYTPLLWHVVVHELDSAGEQYTHLACYEVWREDELIECRYLYASSDMSMAWHVNPLTTERAHVDEVLGALMRVEDENTMELNQSTIDMINMVLQVGIPALAVLLAVSLAAVVGKQWVSVWKYGRGYVPALLEAINEDDDTAIKLIARYAPALAPLVVEHGPVFLRALADALDKLANIPPREVNIGEAGK